MTAGLQVSRPNHRNSDILGLEGNLGFQLAITPTGRQKASKTVESSASGTSLSFGAVNPSRSADWNAVIGHFGTQSADGRWEEKRRVFVPVER
jgi:hypothetical protein